MKISRALLSRSVDEPHRQTKNPVLSKLLLAAAIVSMSFSLSCQQPAPAPPDTRAADEAALKQWDDEWAKAASAKDVDKTVSYYADGALVLPPNGPTLTTKDEIRKAWHDMLTAPGFKGGWKSTKIEVARSGELAYVSGTWEFTMNDASGKPAVDRGNYLEIAKKQADGSWKCVADIWNSTLPLPAPPASK